MFGGMQDSPKGREIKSVEGSPSGIIARGSAIERLGKMMDASADTLRDIKENTFAGGEQQGKAIEKLQESIGDSYKTLEEAADLYKPVGPVLVAYGEMLETYKPLIDRTAASCSDLWDIYDALPGDKDDSTTEDDGGFLGIGDTDKEEAADNKAKKEAYDNWETEAEVFDTWYDVWEDGFDAAVSGISDGLSGSIEDGFWDNYGDFIDAVYEVLTWAALIIAVVAIFCTGFGALAAILALAAFAVSAIKFACGQQSLGQLITSLVTIVGVLVMMISISPVMTLIALVTLPICVAFTGVIAKRSQKYFADQQKIIGELNGHVEEMYTGHKIIKVLVREQTSIAEFRGINGRLHDVAWKAQFVSGIIMPLLNFVNNVGYVAVCVAGGLLVTRNMIKIGDIQAFIQYMRTFTQPIVQTANIANVIQSTVASAERVFEVLDEIEQVAEREDAIRLSAPHGEVVFDHVHFGYTEDSTLIEDMNVHVKPGDTIAIVGPTGAGKTTLVNLLMRFYEIKGGAISVDGVDIRDMRRGDLRTLFGMVLQDTWLFNGSIRDNIAYGREGATDEQITAAAVAAHADHFIRALPEGYDTILNEDATNISQGQKQLLTIARAILADPAVLILDEATSNVDTRSEVLIQRAMHRLMNGRTSFVIAHRLSTIRDADLILVMNHGTIIEQGTHHELLQKGGFYADLYNSQFAGRAS